MIEEFGECIALGIFALRNDGCNRGGCLIDVDRDHPCNYLDIFPDLIAFNAAIVIIAAVLNDNKRHITAVMHGRNPAGFKPCPCTVGKLAFAERLSVGQFACCRGNDLRHSLFDGPAHFCCTDEVTHARNRCSGCTCADIILIGHGVVNVFCQLFLTEHNGDDRFKFAAAVDRILNGSDHILCDRAGNRLQFKTFC